MRNKSHITVAANIKAVGDNTGEFEGYGSVFGVVDCYDEVVTKGAFSESLKEKMPALLLQHASWMVGGIYTDCREDEKGLFVKGQLNLDVQAARECYSLMKQGAIKGLSIGYCVLADEWDKVQGIRYLKKLDLMEVSIVTFPANAEAQVSGVKAAPGSIRDFEKFLREGGYSQEDAKLIASKGYRALELHREGSDVALALDTLKGVVDQLTKSLPSGITRTN